MIRRYVLALFAFISLASTSAFAADRIFTIPLNSLKEWSEAIVIRLSGVTIMGNSNVHPVKDDCEMHFGAKVDGYSGDPAGWVLEPMNLCVEKFFGKKKYSKTDWTNFGSSLKNRKVTATGVPRIWPEHLVGGKGPSNPNHALELHPLTGLEIGARKYDFAKFIYVPDGFSGGLSSATANKLLQEIEVSVTTTGGEVEIDFDAGRIGNFATLDLTIDRDGIKDKKGGHQIPGEVVLSRNAKVKVIVATIAGSDIDKEIVDLKNRKQRFWRIQGLVLFSLDPAALYEAARQSAGQKKAVETPIQLILYGKEED